MHTFCFDGWCYMEHVNRFGSDDPYGRLLSVRAKASGTRGYMADFDATTGRFVRQSRVGCRSRQP